MPCTAFRKQICNGKVGRFGPITTDSVLTFSEFPTKLLVGLRPSSLLPQSQSTPILLFQSAFFPIRMYIERAGC